MTDRDPSDSGFLGRWSRKKIEAERETPEAPVEPVATDAPPPNEPGLPAQPVASANNVVADAPKPEFDLTSLPSLESITAATDIRAFLSPGVPSELARAALRRAWAADPAILNFKGLAENDWDFTDPNAMAGFGELPPGYDITKLMTQIFGDGDKPALPNAAIEPPTVSEVPNIAEEITSTEVPDVSTSEMSEETKRLQPAPVTEEQTIAQSEMVQRGNITAAHNDRDLHEEERQHRRQHGGALPQ